MNLYWISQNVVRGYDTYSDAVVCAATPEDARMIHPGGRGAKYGFLASEEGTCWYDTDYSYRLNDWSS